MTRRARLIGAALVVASALIAVPAAGAKPRPRHKPEPDLVIRKITVDGLPANPFVVMEPDGTVQHFTITVTTANIGDATAPKTTTYVQVERPGKVFGRVRFEVPRLLPGHFARHTAVAKDLDFELGHFFVRARANYILRSIDESNFRNDELTSPEIPVIARQWKVDKWTTHVVSSLAGQDSANVAQAGMIFHFSRYDAAGGRFLYSVIGAATETVKITNQACTVTGDASAQHNPWNVPESSLSISYALTSYEGILDGSSEPTFLITAACQEGERSFEAHWDDLTTSVAMTPRHSMSDTARSLSDGGTFGSIIEVTNAWQFHADIP
ncbi:MAG: hypothetical protein ACXVR1_11650 [Solirubrobacteraceae bacterium]